jgi:diguanylate cyclase (GGDEF)-like protein
MGEVRTRTLTAEQSLRLLGARRTIPAGLPPEALLVRLATHVASIVGAAAAFAGYRAGVWSILAASSDAVDARLLTREQASFGGAVAAIETGVGHWESHRATWTLVPIAALGRDAVLMVEGDWTPSAHALLDAAAALCDEVESPTAIADVALAAFELARDLAAVSGLREVCELAVRYAVKTLPCRVATFAVPTDQGNLSIVATHGYPVALTEHLRIAPGAGVIGAVYQNGVPLRVADVTTAPGFERRRSRYRTTSFAALPVSAGSDVLGVLCVTDREGDVPLSVDDVANLGMLLAPVALALARERTERQVHFYAQAAIVDPSSGLFNRPYFQSRLQEELQRSTRQNTPVSLLMLDIDSFKSINDTFGHLAGDTVIKDVADILKSSVRVFDVCARYGGEEFAVVMPGSSLESASAIAERIRQRIHSYHSTDRTLAGLRVSVSIGVAESGPLGSVRDVIERADAALYAAKRAGKDRVSTSPGARG